MLTKLNDNKGQGWDRVWRQVDAQVWDMVRNRAPIRVRILDQVRDQGVLFMYHVRDQIKEAIKC